MSVKSRGPTVDRARFPELHRMQECVDEQETLIEQLWACIPLHPIRHRKLKRRIERLQVEWLSLKPKAEASLRVGFTDN